MAESFTCPRCLWTSHNANDVREGYCGHCHDWTRDNPARARVTLNQSRKLLRLALERGDVLTQAEFARLLDSLPASMR